MTNKNLLGEFEECQKNQKHQLLILKAPECAGWHTHDAWNVFLLTTNALFLIAMPWVAYQPTGALLNINGPGIFTWMPVQTIGCRLKFPCSVTLSNGKNAYVLSRLTNVTVIKRNLGFFSNRGDLVGNNIVLSIYKMVDNPECAPVSSAAASV